VEVGGIGPPDPWMISLSLHLVTPTLEGHYQKEIKRAKSRNCVGSQVACLPVGRNPEPKYSNKEIIGSRYNLEPTGKEILGSRYNLEPTGEEPTEEIIGSRYNLEPTEKGEPYISRVYF